MLKTILIDDEKLALEFLERELEPFADIQVVGKYTNPYQALVEIMNEELDIVFLDIEIPEINGVDLAKKIKRHSPDINVIFITSYDHYAVRAFEIGTVDYLLKPVDGERLEKALSRITASTREKTVYPMICCFQELRFIYHGERAQLLDVNWRTARAKELFAYLIHNRNRLVRKDVIVEELWAEVDIKDKFSLLYNSIYHIRSTLKSIEFPVHIQSVDGGYRLELNGVLIDVEEWEKGLERSSYVSQKSILKQIELMKLYRGDYFEMDDYFWANHERERLKVRSLHVMETIGDYYMSTEDYVAGSLLFLQFQKIAPYQETIYFRLMQMYYALGDLHSVKWQYHLLTEMTEVEYGTTPDESITDWYEKIS